MENEPMASRSIYVPANLISALEALAKGDSRNFNNYVRIVLEDHVAKAEAKAARAASRTPQVPA